MFNRKVFVLSVSKPRPSSALQSGVLTTIIEPVGPEPQYALLLIIFRVISQLEYRLYNVLLDDIGSTIDVFPYPYYYKLVLLSKMRIVSTRMLAGV